MGFRVLSLALCKALADEYARWRLLVAEIVALRCNALLSSDKTPENPIRLS